MADDKIKYFGQEGLDTLIGEIAEEIRPDVHIDENTAIEVKGETVMPMPFKLGIDENGNYGYYKVGADTVTPFKSGGDIKPGLYIDPIPVEIMLGVINND